MLPEFDQTQPKIVCREMLENVEFVSKYTSGKELLLDILLATNNQVDPESEFFQKLFNDPQIQKYLFTILRMTADDLDKTKELIRLMALIYSKITSYKNQQFQR